MDIIINATSMTPIYEQIVDRIRALIKGGEIKAGEPLPSVRGLARQCAISALTAKKAYDVLEQEGLVATAQGKGTFVAFFAVSAEIAHCRARPRTDGSGSPALSSPCLMSARMRSTICL